MMETLVCASTNLFRIYIIHKFILIFLGDARPDRKKEILAAGVFFFTNTGFYLLFHLPWINVLCNLLGIGSMVALYTKSFRTNLFVTSSIYIVNMACDTITVLFIGYNQGQKVSLTHNVITVFLILICELISEKIISYRRNIDTVESLLLVLAPFSSMAVLLFMVYERRQADYELVIISLGLMFINFIVFYLYNMLLKAFSRKYEHELLKQWVQIYSNQLHTLLESEARVKNLRHDMKHHLNELKLLAAKNDLRAVQDYLDDMQDYLENPEEIVSSGNLEIDSILNYMLQTAKRELRSVHSKIQLPEEMAHSFDITVILGNLLENAIEAARQTEEKYLRAAIQFTKGVLKIEIENSFHGLLQVQKDSKNGALRLETSKDDKGKHGIGLNSVRKIVEKYDGMMDVCPHGSRFTVKLILYMAEGSANFDKNIAQF